MPPHGPLAALLADRPVVACLGAGGVGKTTIAAAVAVGLAAAGRRVLCLTIDPARRLADSLGLAPGDAEEEAVIPPERLAEAGVPAAAGFHVAQLDPDRTFAAVVRRTAPDDRTAERILGNRLFRYLSATLPGVSEAMALERLFAAREDPRFDVIVLDTPPTASALDFLDAPRRLAAALDSPFAAWLAGGARAGVGAWASHRGAHLVVRLLGRLAGPGLLDEMAGLLADAQTLLPGFRARVVEIDALLRSPAVAFVVVASARPAAIDEAIFVHERLAALGAHGGALVVNRVLSPLDVADPAAAATVPAGEDLRRRLAAAAEEWEGRAAADEEQVRRLVRRCGAGGRTWRVPAFPGDVRDLPAVARVAATLFAPEAVVTAGP